MSKYKTAHLFVDISKKSEKTAELMDYLEQFIKQINYNGYIIEVVGVLTLEDKETLHSNGVTHLPTLLFNKNQVNGSSKIIGQLSRIARPPPKKKDAEDILHDEQMAEMDMAKVDNGDDDDNNDDEEDAFAGGDKDAVKENISKRIREFNNKRVGRVEDTFGRKGKGAKVKKPVEDDYDSDDDGPKRPKKQQKGGATKRPGKAAAPSTEINLEDFDLETQQLLDKGGSD